MIASDGSFDSWGYWCGYRQATQTFTDSLQTIAPEMAAFEERQAEIEDENRRERRAFWRDQSRKGWRRPRGPARSSIGRRRPEIRRRMGNANPRD